MYEYRLDQCQFNLTSMWIELLDGYKLLFKRPKMPINEKTEECPICGKMQKQLPRHMKIHNDRRPFKCRYCGKDFKRKDVLSGHELTHLKKPSDKMDKVKKKTPTPKKCLVCGKLVVQLGAHMRIQHEPKQFKCHFCGKDLKSNQHWRTT